MSLKRCVGVISDRNVGILTEDLTSNSESELVHQLQNEIGFINKNGVQTQVYVDIDHLFRPLNGGIKYFMYKYRVKL